MSPFSRFSWLTCSAKACAVSTNEAFNSNTNIQKIIDELETYNQQKLTGCQKHIIVNSDCTRNYQPQTKSRKYVRVIGLNTTMKSVQIKVSIITSKSY